MLNRNLRIDDGHAYALLWSVPEGQWSARRAAFDTVAQSFRPAS